MIQTHRLALAVAVFAATCAAANAQTERVRGTILKAEGNALSLKSSSTIVLKYKGGEKTIVVPADAPIVRYEIGSRDDLRPGAALTAAAATRKPDGTLEVNRINVGRDGVVPR